MWTTEGMCALGALYTLATPITATENFVLGVDHLTEAMTRWRRKEGRKTEEKRAACTNDFRRHTQTDNRY